MRPFEVSLVLGLVTLGVLIFASTAKLYKQILLFACLVLLGLHLWLEGAHWQMFPAYLGFIFAVVCTPFLSRQEGIRRIAGSAIVLLCLCTISFSIALPMFSLPKPTGPYAVGTRLLFLENYAQHEPLLPDPSARRKLVVQIWYPADSSEDKVALYRKWKESDLISTYQSVIRTNSRVDAPILTSEAPFPVILFSHGIGGRRGSLTYLMEDLASHGYVVAAIDHPNLAARVEWSDGTIMRGTKRFLIINPGNADAAAIKADWDKEAELTARDQIFVLNTLEQDNYTPSSFWYRKLNTKLAGSFGHSFGGAAAQYACSVDSRIRSSINIDGWSLGGLNPDSDKPVMYLYGDLDSMRLDDPELSRPPRNAVEQVSWDDLAAIKRGLEQHGGYMINLTKTNHLDFTDKALISAIPQIRRRSELGPIKPDEVFAIVRSYVLAFFNETLLQQPSPLLAPHAQSPFPEVTIQRWSPSQGNDNSREGQAMPPTVP